jgi:parallel beta-helix repeat protein
MTTVIIMGVLFSSNGATCWATDWYVDANGPNNPGTGSWEDPFRKIQYAVDEPNIAPGDNVYVRGGTYYEGNVLNITCSGTEGNYITFQPYNNEVPVIELSKTEPNWTSEPNGIYNKVFDDFHEHDRYGGLVKKDEYGITKVNDVDFYEFASTYPDVDMFCFDTDSNTVRVKLVSGDPNDVYVIVNNNRVHIAEDANYVEMRGFTIQYGTHGVDCAGDNVRLINNTIKHTRWQGVVASANTLLIANDLLIEGNNISYTGKPWMYDPCETELVPNNQDHSIYLSTADGAIVRNNYAEKCIGGHSMHPWHSDNSFPKNCEIYENYIDGTYGGFVGSGTNNKVYNNIILSGDGWGVNVWPSSGYSFYNNLIKASEGIAIGSGIGTVTDITVRNNIVYAKTNNYCVSLQDDTELSSANLDYNTYYGGTKFYVDSQTFTNFNDYQSHMDDEYNLEAYSFYSDPNFVDADANNFHLDANSPCINAGDPYLDYSGQKDIDGDARVSGSRVDIGPDETPYCVHNVTDDYWYTTIQGAINGASTSDLLEVWPGTYMESIDFGGKAITVRSTDPIDWDVVNATIIDANCDANNVGRALTFDSGEDANSILMGFTITGGYSDGNFPESVGGGIYCDLASPAISNCVIRNNYGFAGGGMFNFYSSPKLTNCIFTENESGHSGGGVYNSQYGSVTLFNCTFSKNSCIYDGGGMYSYACSPAVTNCIFWGNQADGSGDEIYNYSADPNFAYCDIEGCKPGGVWDPNFGTDLGGNIDSDPCFVNPYANDFHLDSDSPCIDTGDPNGDYDFQIDIDGQPRVMVEGVDMGADEFPRVHNITQNKWYVHINNAIGDANDDDEIEVYKDTFYETIDFDGKALTLRSTDPNDWTVVADTIIDVNWGSYGVHFHNSEDANSVLRGFTVTKGDNGVYCYSASPTISNCIIEDHNYIGVCCYPSSVTIENCVIKDNGWYGIYALGSPTIRYNKISENYYDGIALVGSSSSVKSNWIYDNGRYGVMIISSSSAVLRNNTIIGNTTAGIYKHSGTQPIISNCILWYNDDDLYDCTATYSCIENGDAGTGNISSDPLFEDPNNDDFHLDMDSPCINTGDPNGDYTGQTDIDGEPRVMDVRIDMGADESLPVPVAYWKMDDNAATTTVLDSSVNGNNGTFNDPTGDPNTNAHNTTGQIDDALTFDGSNDSVDCGSDNILEITDALTYAAWIKPDVLGSGYQLIISKNSIWTRTLFLNGSYIRGFVNYSTTDASSMSIIATIQEDVWQHVTFVLEDKTIYLYVDGQEVDYDTQTTGVGTPIDYSSNSLIIGGYGDGKYFDGTIDDVMIFDKALSAEEISELAN